MRNEPKDTPSTSPTEFLRIPGLFRRWEIEQILEPGADFHLEEAGAASDGTRLYAIFRRHAENPDVRKTQRGTP